MAHHPFLRLRRFSLKWKLVTYCNQLIAHVRAEFCNMGLFAAQAEFGLHPLVGLPLGHKAALPEPVKGFMSKDALMT